MRSPRMAMAPSSTILRAVSIVTTVPPLTSRSTSVLVATLALESPLRHKAIQAQNRISPGLSWHRGILRNFISLLFQEARIERSRKELGHLIRRFLSLEVGEENLNVAA